ncbi:unnamed protein product [Cochlearia groenlandica]
MKKSSFVVDLLFLLLAISVLAATPAFSDLVLSKVERRIDVTSQIARVTKTLKVVNSGSDSVSEFTLTFPKFLGKNLAYLSVSHSEGKGKSKRSLANLSVEEVAKPKGIPDSISVYSVKLPKPIKKGDALTLEVIASFTNVLQPFPEKISQADIHLVMLQESAQYLSPYAVESQSLTIKLPNARIESYTKLDSTKLQGTELKYGPYKNLQQFSYAPIVVHFESKAAFAVAENLVREIEVSHWGNVQVTEHYNLVHRGAQLKGEFSRLDFQARPPQGVSAFRHLLARLPPRAHSIYYRDDIGNISTSQMQSDSKKTELLIEPRFPLFGGWKTFFTIGYGLPLSDFLFALEGKRFLDISFGSPMHDLVTEKLIVQVVLPEGSKDISVTTPFAVKQSQEIKYSHLDIAGRPVVVLEKNNVVPDHNQNIQVYYKFSNINLLSEPLMLISGFFVLFITCIIYTRADFSISKSSASYLAKLHWDEVLATLQEVQSIIHKCLAAHDKLEASLRDLSRTGDIQTCKAARKSTDSLLKDLLKETKPLIAFLQSSPSASQISPKVEELSAKEKELEEKLMAKHTTVVEGYEKKSSGRDIENRIATQQQKITALRQEIEDLLEFIDEI